MKILAFVDLHGDKTTLKKLVDRAKKKDIELVVCPGDVTIFGEQQKDILLRLNKIGKPILIIHGNHEEASELRKDCEKFKNCYFIHNKKFRKDDYLFIGWGGGGFSKIDEGLKRNLKKLKKWIKDDKVIFMTHAPPYHTKVDKIHNQHVGNKTILDFIKSVKPILNICGHLHENEGKEDKVGRTKVINPSYKGKIIEI